MTALRPEVRRAAMVGTVAAAAMIAAVVATKATRDALFLDVFPASQLPTVMLVSAALSFGAVVVASATMAKVGPHRFVPVAFGVHAALFVLEYALLEAYPRGVAVGLYLHVAVVGSLLVSGFWSLVSERFDPHSAKRVMGRLNAGATSGGLLGGVVAELVARRLDAHAMLLILAGLAALCGVAVMILGRGIDDHDVAQHRIGGAKLLERAPYLRMLALLVMVIAIMSGLLDYAFKATAQAQLTRREDLMSFFALFYTGSSLLTFVLQAGFGKRVLDRLGLGTTLALLPAAVLVSGAFSAAFTRLWTVVVARASESVLVNSWYRSGYELLFTPLPPDTKRPTKAVIDVGFDRLGTAAASGLILAALAVAPDLSTRVALGGAAVAATLALFVASRLHRGYVAELAKSLRSGTLTLDEDEVVDATTRRTLADTTMAIDREKLLAEIEELRQSQDEGSPAAATAFDAALRGSLDDLLSGDGKRIRTVLQPPVDPRLVGFVIDLLGDPSFGRPARRVLRQTVGRDAGQLCDAILDPSFDQTVRRRLPAVLASAPSARTAQLLVQALAADDDEVRQRVVSALEELIVRAPEHAPTREVVFEHVHRALDCDPVSLPRIFSLLTLALDAEPVRLSLHALKSDDPRLRGTSVEYLDNVLPEEIRDRLVPHLLHYAPSSSRAPASRRSRRELEEALLRSSDALPLPPRPTERRSDPPQDP